MKKSEIIVKHIKIGCGGFYRCNRANLIKSFFVVNLHSDVKARAFDPAKNFLPSLNFVQ